MHEKKNELIKENDKHSQKNNIVTRRNEKVISDELGAEEISIFPQEFNEYSFDNIDEMMVEAEQILKECENDEVPLDIIESMEEWFRNFMKS